LLLRFNLNQVDLLVKNARIITAEGSYDGAIGIRNGQIQSITKNASAPSAGEVIDAKGNLVLPGCIDAHSHFRDLERSSFEDFESGTKSAAAGGLTTCIEMPTTIPPTSTVEGFQAKLAAANKKSVVDFALYAGAGTHNIQEIEKLATIGAAAYKTFTMIYPGREKDMMGIYPTDDGSFFDVLAAVAKTNRPWAVHAENGEMIEYFAKKVKAKGGRDLKAYLESKPGIAEGEATLRSGYIARAAGARMHIVHVSAKEVVEVIKMLRGINYFATAETCPHYLTFTIEEAARLGPYGKVSPPIREKADQKALWRAVAEGEIQIIGSDHAPFDKEHKERGRKDVFLAQAGVTGIQAMLPVMLTHVKNGRLSLQKLVSLMALNPAKLYGLFPGKGTIQVGSDADLVIVEYGRESKLSVDDFYSKDKGAAIIYDGYRVYGRPLVTISRGRIVAREGVVNAEPGSGRFLKPGPSIPLLPLGSFARP